MAENDLTVLRHDVTRHGDDIEKLAKRIDELETQNKLLRRCLEDAVVLCRTLYGLLGRDKMGPSANELRVDLRKRLNELHKRLDLEDS